MEPKATPDSKAHKVCLAKMALKAREALRASKASLGNRGRKACQATKAHKARKALPANKAHKAYPARMGQMVPEVRKVSGGRKDHAGHKIGRAACREREGGEERRG